MTFTSKSTGSSEGLVAYFGYGSLVCRATHRTEIVDAIPARLKEWRRHWRPRPDMPGFPAALLSVRPDETAICDGLLVIDRAENLSAVDAREARYRRIAIDPADLIIDRVLPADFPVWLYVADETLPPHREPPAILRSYLDAVLLGFTLEHGEDGLHRFLAETEGFDTPIHDDREAPVYPRAVSLEAHHAGLIEAALAARAKAG